jgi:hypothetical protein
VIVVMALSVGSGGNGVAAVGAAIMGLTALTVGALVYFIPSFAANYRGHPSMGQIFLLNLLLGWTVIGWLAAFVWAAGYSDGSKERQGG